MWRTSAQQFFSINIKSLCLVFLKIFRRIDQVNSITKNISLLFFGHSKDNVFRTQKAIEFSANSALTSIQFSSCTQDNAAQIHFECDFSRSSLLVSCLITDFDGFLVLFSCSVPTIRLSFRYPIDCATPKLYHHSNTSWINEKTRKGTLYSCVWQMNEIKWRQTPKTTRKYE